MKRIVLLLIVFTQTIFGFSQDLTQTIRGTVIDQESQTTLPGVNIVLIGSEPIIGTTTDVDGNFRLEKVPVGRQSIKITSLGFEEVTIPEIMVGSAKEIVLTIKMQEALTKIDEVVIKANQNQGQPMNDMTSVSARSFTVEETKRYPAGISDPGRMALSFAGVATTNDISNEIVIRGNSPNGLLWRLEGVEIPSPNHFAEEGTSSGFVSILSSNMLGNSDFLTGAFPSEYGNALSGIFDISLRNGNNEKHEFAFQFGLMGTEIAAEGPLTSNKRSSYLVNYRYSTLSIFDKIGLKIVGDQVPNYQDLSFKFNLPSEKAGKFSIWFIGGKGSSTVIPVKDSSQWEGYNDRRSDITETGMTAMGLTHLFFLNDHSYLKSVVSFSGSTSEDGFYVLDSNYYEDEQYREYGMFSAARASIMYNNKLNSRLSLRTGIIGSHLMFDYFAEQKLDDKWITYIDEDGLTQSAQAYAQAKYRLGENLTLNAGLHYLHFILNNNNSLEPRLGISWKLPKSQTIGVGFGIHSRTEQMATYFIQNQNPEGSYTRQNEDLELSKAAHYVLTYDKIVKKDFHIRLECYYQNLFRIPVSANTQSTFSTINGALNLDTLVATGKGENYGLELTVEKFFTNNYYFLITGSLFESMYKPSTGMWYNTKYNLNYITNFIVGREFRVKTNIIGVNAKLLWSGGKRDYPINIAESNLAGYAVRDPLNPYKVQYEDYFRLDVSASYRINREKTAHIISLDIQNVSNRANIAFKDYDPVTQKLEPIYMTGIIPIFNYKLEF